ncbi:MAG: 30S ribosomal protein S8, partial [Candidatus Dadabacteria bacterium]
TDPIADFLTRIRNATMAYRRHVEVPGSKLKRRLAEILKEEGFIEDFSWTDDGKQGILHLTLKYDDVGQPVIEGLERISKPGRRKYVGADELPRVRSGLGVVIVSTSRGLLTGREAREQHVGGEVLCTVW